MPPAGVRMARPEGDHAAILASGRWREAVQAYLATIAFADAQIGRLLDALDASPHRDNTIVCLWSDHGWSLGEKSNWRKFALWEEPTRSILIWRVPGLTPEGGLCEHPVDFSAIFPTLCALAGMDGPDHLEGPDLGPLLRNPSAPWDVPALTTHGRGNHALRLGPWRYIRYADGSEELYDHRADPLEYDNLAFGSLREQHAETIAKLADLLPAEEAPDLPRAR